MLTYENKEYRNLQEQVLKNKEDIAGLKQVSIGNIQIQGYRDSEADLPSPANVVGGFLVGPDDTNRFELYYSLGTRWANLGYFPAPGNEGPVGPQGEQGEQGVSITSTEVTEAGDLFITYSSGDRVYIGNIKGPQGPQGIGLRGEKGDKGDTGERGPQGLPSEVLKIMGVLSNTAYLPDPNTTNRNYAYVVSGNIYGIAETGSTLYWTIMAPVVSSYYADRTADPSFTNGLRVTESYGLMNNNKDSGFMFDAYGAPVITNGADGDYTLGISSDSDPNGAVQWYNFPSDGGLLLAEHTADERYKAKTPSETVLWSGNTEVSNGAESANTYTKTQISVSSSNLIRVGDTIRVYFIGPSTSNSYYNGAGYVEFTVIAPNSSTIAGGGCYMSINQYGPVIVGASVGAYGGSGVTTVTIGVYRCANMYPSVNYLYCYKITRVD